MLQFNSSVEEKVIAILTSKRLNFVTRTADRIKNDEKCSKGVFFYNKFGIFLIDLKILFSFNSPQTIIYKVKIIHQKKEKRKLISA